MHTLKLSALLVTAIILERADAHGQSDTDLFDKIPVVAQKYPSLADMDIDPNFLVAHRRKLESDNQDVSECKPRCAQVQGIAKSCDEIVCILCVVAAAVIQGRFFAFVPFIS